MANGMRDNKLGWKIGGGAVVVIGALVAFLATRGGDGGAKRAAGTASAQAGATTPGARKPDPRTQPRASIKGTVRDDAGAPIPGATVCADPSSDELPLELLKVPTCARSDAAGAYTLDKLLAPARYTVTAAADSFAPEVYRKDGDRGSSWFRLAQGEAKTGVDVVLRKGGVAVTGVVNDLSGGPIAHARVRASQGRWGGRSSLPPVETDERGAFTVWTAPGWVTISASADGYADADESIKAPGKVELLLTPEASVSGIVLDAQSGKPVEGARVQIATPEWRWSQHVSDKTGADGKFRVTGMTPGRFVATATAETAYGRSEGSFLIGLGQHVEDVIVKVHPASRVSGKVVIAGSQGKICPDASVQLTDKEQESRMFGGGADANDVVVIEGVLPGRYSVQVWCASYATRETYPPVEVAGKDVTGLEWEVDPGAAIRGRVLTKSGEPIARAEVVGRSAGGRGRGEYRMDTSRADGRFEIEGLRPGQYRLNAETDQAVMPLDPPVVDIAAGAVVDKDIVLEDSGSVKGLVVDERGSPIANVTVDAWPLIRETSWRDNSSVTDAAGAFELKGLRPGDYRVAARRGWGDMLRKPGTTDDTMDFDKVSVKLGAPASVKLVVSSETGVIRGAVVTADGNPVGDAFLSSARESDAAGAAGGTVRETRGWGWGDTDKPVLTGTDGSFTIDRLAAGKYTIRAYRKGGGEAVAEHVEPGATVKMIIKATGSIEGTVRAGDGSAIAEDLSIQIQDLETGLSREESLFRTGGRYAVRDLPAGHYTVTATASGGSAKVEVDLRDGETKTGVDISLDALVTLTGRVVKLGTTTPVSGMRMSAERESGNGRRYIMNNDSEDRDHITDDQGRFTIKKAPKGKIQITGFPTDFETSKIGFLRIVRTVDKSGTVDLGDIGVLDRRLDKGQVAGELGLSFKEAAPGASMTDMKLEVSFVKAGGAGEKAGIVVGDVITSIDGIDLKGDNIMHAYSLMRAPVGTKLTIGLARGATVTATLTPP